MTDSNQLHEAIRHIRAGNRQAGQALLRTILKENTDDHEAWLWLSSTLDSREEQRYCLERIREIAQTWREFGSLEVPSSLDRALEGISVLGPGSQRRPALFNNPDPLLDRYAAAAEPSAPRYVTQEAPGPTLYQLTQAPGPTLYQTIPAPTPVAPAVSPSLQREVDALVRALAKDPIALGRWLGYGQRLKDELER